MGLIHLFNDHAVNRKSLKECVEVRKSIDERGEFNDRTLLKAEEYLQRLKRDDNATCKAMYAVLNKIIRPDEGHFVEYPIDFIKQILRIYRDGIPAAKVLERYREMLEHHCQTAC